MANIDVSNEQSIKGEPKLNKVRTTITIDPDQLNKARLFAFNNNSNFAQVCQQAVREFLEKYDV